MEQDVKIALISLQQDAERVPPVGLVYLATYLKERAGMDARNIKVLDKNYYDIEKELANFNPNIIGFGAMTVNYGEVITFARKLKKRYNIPFLLGGVHISTLPESLNKVFDMGVIGEGEITLAEIMNIYRKKRSFNVKDLKKIKSIVFYDKDSLIRTPLREPIQNLDSLPIPDFRFVHPNYFRKEEIPSISRAGIKAFLISSRGCPYKCVFCSTAQFWGRMRLNSPDYTARVLKRFIDEFGADFVKVIDDLFTISPSRLRKLREAFEKYGIMKKIAAIECQPRANLMTEELCEEMKKIKIKVINFGFESGSDKIVKWLKKESASLELNKRAIILGTKHGFKVYGSLMYGSPGETIEDMKKTNEFIDFSIRNGVTYMWSFVATPFPATQFWNIALERKKVSNNMEWNLLSHHNLENPLLLDEGIDKKEFQRVFLKGRKKLRRLKLKMISEFLLKNPLFVFEKMVNEPKYYLSRTVKQVFRQ